MARFTSTALFFFIATLINHVFTLPLLRRDNVNQFKVDIQLVTGDLTSLSQHLSVFSFEDKSASQGEDFTSAFSATTNDLEKCITDIDGLKASRIDTADAKIVLKLVKDFTSTILGTLGHLQAKYNVNRFKKSNMISYIRNQVRTLDIGVTELMGNLKKVLPSQSQGEASSLQQQMAPEFQTTISLYSS
ncbi:hypothetical protein AX14_005372 [Amanita brunnescens Koide BX004]|nr:hypothetical protein AX14_005372 [Amanita brunnescens Koide BX004]